MVLCNFGFTYSSQTSPPPQDAQVRANAPAPYTAVTAVYVSIKNDDGEDIWLSLTSLPLGATIYLQDKNDHLSNCRFTITGKPIDRGGYSEIPVTFQAAAGSLLNNQAVLFVATTEAGALPPGPVGPTLITLAEAKTQLRITDTWHDGEIQAALDAADAIVRKYLDTANDPVWDSTTAPDDIKQATKLWTAHIYEHRGDAFGPDQDNDDRVWAATKHILIMYRGPTLA